MTSSTVKCASCNLVINEVLAFITNKIDVMDEESLVRICLSAFKMEEVEKSKNLLFDSITTDIRKIMRKKKSERKTQRDLEDIITVLKSLDPESISIFVAKDLHRLPPVLFDHLDCSALLKDITLLKAQMESIKTRTSLLNSYIIWKLSCTLTDMTR
ncbi:Mutant cadherin [Operophtera brumata]|uniref:Mutant cadherin n=1 Tax=Operophtera brumata TaxID=104452 RepID=A0A0L7K4N1_OPEBR|nr:Mutant cadherin [Operophtera brumata]